MSGHAVEGGEVTITTKGPGSTADVRPCPGGPLLVRGADTVQAVDGVEHPVTRPVVAVCACGKSQRGPWCDGTHKVVRGPVRG